jgi:uncharacterized membrane protein YfcA
LPNVLLPVDLQAVALPFGRPYLVRVMEPSLCSYLLGWTSALLVGLSKNGLPGVGILAVLLTTEVFAEDAKLAIGAMLPVLLLGDVLAVRFYRHHARWRRLVGLMPYVLVGMVPGALLLRTVEGNQLRPVLGGLVLGLLALETTRQVLGLRYVPGGRWFVAITGLLAGFSTIVAHAAGPVMTVYLISQGMDKREFVGTAAWFFFLLNLTKVPFYLSEGMVTPVTLHYDLIVAPAVVVGALLGVYLIGRIPQRLFNVLALLLAAAAAVRLIVA